MFICGSLIIGAIVAMTIGYNFSALLLLLLALTERQLQLYSLTHALSSINGQFSFSLLGIRNRHLQNLIQNLLLRIGNFLELETEKIKYSESLKDNNIKDLLKDSGARLILQVEKQAGRIIVNDLFGMLINEEEGTQIEAALKDFYREGVRTLSLEKEFLGPFSSRRISLIYPFKLNESSDPEVECFIIAGFSENCVPALSQLIRIKKWVISLDRNAAEGRRLARLKNKVLESRSSNIFKNKMIAGLSHDLRSPINNIRALLICIKEDLKGRLEAEELTVLAENNLMHLQELAENLVELAKFRAGKTEIKFEIFSLSDLISEVVFNYKLDADLRKLNLKLVLPAEPVLLMGSRLQIKRILSNILSNALKYTEQGGIIVGTRVAEGTIGFFVKDTGVGLKAEQIKTICEPFRRFTEKEIHGLGLGLSVCKTLAQFNKGRIEINSEPGNGSEFIVTFPAVIQKQQVIAA